MKRTVFVVAILAIFAMFCVSCAGGNYRAKRPCSPCPPCPVTTVTTATVTVYPSITVDYSRSLEEMIAAGKYNNTTLVTSYIDSKHFPLKGSGKRTFTPKVVYFGKAMMADDVLDELDRLGLQPAKIEEQLAFGEEHTEEYTEYPLVAMGSRGHYPYGDWMVPFIGQCDDYRYLNLLPYEYQWSYIARFLAVDKE